MQHFGLCIWAWTLKSLQKRKGLEFCVLMEVGRNQANRRDTLLKKIYLKTSVDGIGIAKYSPVSLMFADMKMKVPFVSRTIGTIHFISSLTLFCSVNNIHLWFFFFQHGTCIIPNWLSLGLCSDIHVCFLWLKNINDSLGELMYLSAEWVQRAEFSYGSG